MPINPSFQGSRQAVPRYVGFRLRQEQTILVPGSLSVYQQRAAIHLMRRSIQPYVPILINQSLACMMHDCRTEIMPSQHEQSHLRDLTDEDLVL